MYYRGELLIGGLQYRITDDIRNWDEISVSFKRNDYDGVVRSFSSKFQFVGGARQLLLKEWEGNYLNAAASIIISTRNNSWMYSERFRCALNFSTMNDDGHILSINAIDDSVAALIKAKKGTQYEYAVSGMKEEQPLYYDGLEMISTAKWIDGGTLNDDGTISVIPVRSSGKSFPLYMETSEIAVRGVVELYDVEDEAYGQNDVPNMFVKALSDVTLDVKIQFKVKAMQDPSPGNNGGYMILRLHKIVESTRTPLYTLYLNNEKEQNFNYVDSVQLKKGEGLALIMGQETSYATEIGIVGKMDTRISFVSRNEPVKLDIIKPETVLNCLLRSINGENDGLTGIIEKEGNERMERCMILAAESARNLPNAKLYTSFEKFSKWMSAVFGFVYDINGNVITFRHRGRYFGKEVTKTIKNLNDYELTVVSSMVYSRVRIGYDKQDYDSVNGRDEFHFTNEYTTGINITDNALEIISPYRADAYGIEFLVDSGKGETTDDASDTDVFFVGVQYWPLPSEGERPSVYAGMYTFTSDHTIEGVLSPNTMFNVEYSPTSMIKANEGYIGASVSRMEYASSDGNSEVVIDGLAENRDIDISEKLFVAAEYSMKTADVDLPEDLTGIVQFEYNGEPKQGYYKSADYNYTRMESSKVTLIVKS